MASSSSSSAAHLLKYDVFLNFRGEDTRRGFTSHLCAALRRKDLQTFLDDDDLKRGEEIAQSLPQAIQDSTVAILVFSKDYASSRWCLDELVEIIKCHRSHGQIVIPIFYEVDPSHLRKQSHDIAAAFVKHEQNPHNAHKIQKWRDALTTAANLSGFDSKEFRNDDLLINKIVEEILEKLNQSMPCDDFEHLVGMDLRIKEIKEVFTINPSETCILGIWGMGGVGKTTAADVIYKKMSPQFDSYCFVENVGQRVEASGIIKLQEEFISEVLGEEDSQKYTFNFLKKRLGSKKVLIVFDDAKDSQQFENLIGDPCWFGRGSRILVTSRNKQVFKRRADFIYKLKLLNDDEALQLFNKNAFNYPEDDYASLSESIVKYAQGNPLALKVLGSALFGKGKEEWESALAQLSKVQNKDIQQVLEISYRQIYVHRDILRKIYKSSGVDIDITLSVLVDKCLITSKYPLTMHDLLQEMGKEIVREAQYSYQRRRLWDPEDIYEVFAGNKEAEAVETITLDLSKIREMNLDPQVFMKMPNLRFLDFYGESSLHFSQGLDYLPNTLRYFRWDKYPLEFLPPNFQQDSNLVVVELSSSNIKQLLKKDSFISRVIRGIVDGCWRLKSLILQNESITQLPSGRSGFLEALEVLDLCDCSNLNTFPEISSNIKKLYLSNTAIRQIPLSSVERLSKLEYLELQYCRELESLPSNFFSKLTSLLKLDLHGCSRFKVLPEILEPRRYVLSINITNTAIEKLPSVIGSSNGRCRINMIGCSTLAFLPSSKNCGLEDILPLGYSNFFSYNLSELPIVSLDLSGNDFERIPISFKQFSKLEMLIIDDCERLLSLPELPSNVQKISACRCSSLEEIWTLKQLPLNSPLAEFAFNFGNCFKLDKDDCHEVVNALLRNYTRTSKWKSSPSFQMIYPGSEVPKHVKYQSMGDSIEIHHRPLWLDDLAFAFYLCVDSDGQRFHFDCYCDDISRFSSDGPNGFDMPRADREHMVVCVRGDFVHELTSCSVELNFLRQFSIKRSPMGDFLIEMDFMADPTFKFTFKFRSAEVEKVRCGVIPLD